MAQKEPQPKRQIVAVTQAERRRINWGAMHIAADKRAAMGRG